MNDESVPERDIWPDIAWGVGRGLALACLPIVLTVLPGRLPLHAQMPRSVDSSEVSLAIFGIGAALGALAGLFRPMAQAFWSALVLGTILATTALGLIRWFVPARADRPPFPFAGAVLFGLILGLALYFGELHRRTARNSLSA